MRFGVGVIDAEADDPSRCDAESRASPAAPEPGVAVACGAAVPRISRHRTRQGFLDAMSSTTECDLGIDGDIAVLLAFGVVGEPDGACLWGRG
jgi:hypothetical protein